MSGEETLSRLPIGRCARVVGFDLPASQRLRLLEMGLTMNSTVEVIRFAPLGDPIEIKVRGYHLSLRLHEASGIRVGPLEK